MARFASLLVTALLVLGATYSSAQQRPIVTGTQSLPNANPQGRPPATGTGLILGQVVESGTTTPVPGAIVSLNGTATPASGSAQPSASFVQARRVFADAQGRFTFSDLPAGSFTLTATSPGYQPGVAGQTQPGTPSPPLLLRPDQKLGGLTISLWKYAAISGTVMDEVGEPTVNTTVRVLRRIEMGRATRFMPAQTARTDDRGVYRIAGLSPGAYVVTVPSTTTTMPASVVDVSTQLSRQGSDGAAAAREFSERLQSSGAPTPYATGIRVGDAFLQTGPFEPSSVGVIAREDGTLLVQPALYFPAATSATSATVVTLASGEERASVDFQLNPVRGFSVSGTLLAPEGQAANLGVRLLPADIDNQLLDGLDAGLETGMTISDASGQFTFMGVPSGAYQLRVLHVPRPAPLPPPPPPPPTAGAPMTIPAQTVRPLPPTEPTLFAQLPVSVGGANVAGLSVTLRTGPKLSGRVEFDGVAPKPALGEMSQVRVTLMAAGGSGIGGVPSVVSVDGQFTTMSMPPGRYLVTANAPGWTLRTAMVNGRDASQVPLDLDANDVSGMLLTFFDRPAQLTGTVRNARGEPDASAMVLLVDTNYQECLEQAVVSRCLRNSPTNASGAFNLSGLLPGDYLIAAIDRSALSATMGPASALELVAPLATRVTLGESMRQTQDLTTRALPQR